MAKKRQRQTVQPVGKLRCTGKRRYRSQGDALDAAMIVGVERQRRAYQCPFCGLWHLTSV